MPRAEIARGSTWALADGGLVFCEDDLIFELDGWEEADKALY